MPRDEATAINPAGQGPAAQHRRRPEDDFLRERIGHRRLGQRLQMP